MAIYYDANGFATVRRQTKNGSRKYLYTVAYCDDCGSYNEIRSTYALRKIEDQNGKRNYKCKVCTSRGNLEFANAARSENTDV